MKSQFDYLICTPAQERGRRKAWLRRRPEANINVQNIFKYKFSMFKIAFNIKYQRSKYFQNIGILH